MTNLIYRILEIAKLRYTVHQLDFKSHLNFRFKILRLAVHDEFQIFHSKRNNNQDRDILREVVADGAYDAEYNEACYENVCGRSLCLTENGTIPPSKAGHNGPKTPDTNCKISAEVSENGKSEIKERTTHPIASLQKK